MPGWHALHHSALITAGFILVWLLVGANIASLALRRAHQPLYDWLAGAYVVSMSDRSRA